MVNWFLWGFFFHQNSYLVMLSKFSFSVPVFSQAYVLLLWCQWRHNLQLLRIRKWEILKMNITVQHCNNFFFFETLRFLIECSNFVIQDGWWHFSYHLCTYTLNESQCILLAVPNILLKKKTQANKKNRTNNPKPRKQKSRWGK